MIDLDNLERKAAAASPGGMLADDCLRWDHHGWSVRTRAHPEELDRARSDAAYLAANSPPVTLALIARIRELEGTLRESIAHHRSVRDLGRDEGMLIDADEVNEETAWINGLMRLLKKGAVLP